MVKTTAERVAALRLARDVLGLKRRELYAHPEDWPAIKALAEKLQRKRAKLVAKYKADDGAEFNNEADCIAHEALCAEIAEVVRLLPPRPQYDGGRFANGGGYIQHDEKTFHMVREALLRIANRLFPHKWLAEALEKHSEVHASYPGRIIYETSPPVARAWYRFMCTDKSLREWGQPYYADYPHEAEQVRLN